MVPQDYWNSPPIDYPAYADELAYGPYGGSPWTPGTYQPNQTGQLPPSWQPPPGDEPTAAPEPPRSPGWLWLAAGAAVLLVVGMIVALVVANGSSRRQTAIEPLPPIQTPGPAYTPPTTASPPPATPRRPPRTTTTGPSTTGPGTSTAPAIMETVVYRVTGAGRAISVVYLDTGDMIQTEFNVALPWTKQVRLAASSRHSASVTVVNIGHDVTCSVSVAGVQVRQRTGQGLTICDAPL